MGWAHANHKVRVQQDIECPFGESGPSSERPVAGNLKYR